MGSLEHLIGSHLQQVLGSFIIFEVTWPEPVLSGIDFLKSASDLIKVDLLEIPGLACPWAGYSYETKFHVSMATPLVISIMLTVPVPIAWYLARQDEKKKRLHQSAQSLDVESTAAAQDGEDRSINWGMRFEKTVDTFMNNIMCVYSCTCAELTRVHEYESVGCVCDRAHEVWRPGAQTSCAHTAGSGSSSCIQVLRLSRCRRSCAKKLPIPPISLPTSEKGARMPAYGCACVLCVCAGVHFCVRVHLSG
jgi:hypothetical protein